MSDKAIACFTSHAKIWTWVQHLLKAKSDEGVQSKGNFLSIKCTFINWLTVILHVKAFISELCSHKNVQHFTVFSIVNIVCYKIFLQSHLCYIMLSCLTHNSMQAQNSMLKLFTTHKLKILYVLPYEPCQPRSNRLVHLCGAFSVLPYAYNQDKLFLGTETILSGAQGALKQEPV